VTTGTMFDIKEMRHELNATYLNVMIALQVKTMRLSKNWSQSDLAAKADTTYQEISLIESPRWKHWPHISTLLKIAGAFDCAFECRFRPWSEAISEFLCDSQITTAKSFEEEYAILSHAFGSSLEPLLVGRSDSEQDANLTEAK